MRPLFLAPVALTVLALLPLGDPSAAQERTAAGEEFFARKVAPVLRRSCVECHNGAKSRGGLDLSARQPALSGGDTGPVLVPGHADRSLLLKLVQGPRPKMPQKGKPLSAQEVAALRTWIDAGAAWPKGLVLARAEPSADADEPWWSFRSLERPPLPAVKDARWVRTPIDAFVLAVMELHGLSPSPEVDRATYIRRATFDLHGLPPTPEEVEAFVNDRSPDTYERLIDRLLASPRYGERWGRYWLDIIHYADTHGFDKDKRRLWAWLFRDWVIRALNRDLPYRRFVRYQLAGDVLAPDDPEGVIATGFVVAGPWDFVGHVELREGTVDKEKTRLLDRDDMVSSTVSTFVSLTAHCARCHDHKFDPISQKDYYRLQAVFAGVERGDRSFVTPKTRRQRLALERQIREATGRKASLQKRVAARTTPELARLDERLARLRRELDGLPLPAGKGVSPSNGYHSGIAARPDVVKWVQVDLGRSVPVERIRLIPARPTDFRDSPGFGFPVRFRVAISDDPTFARAETVADHTRADFPNPGNDPYAIRLEGKRARYVRVTATRLWERTRDFVFALAEVQVESGGRNVARGAAVSALDSIEAGRWARNYLVDNFDSRRPLPDLADPRTAALVRQREDVLLRLRETEQARRALAESLIDAETRTELARAETELTALQARLKTLGSADKVYAVVPRPPRPIHVLHRGDVERKRAPVGPGALALVPGLSPEFRLARPDDEGARRLALADWITDAKNVLTWRSIVNRVWQSHFGRGIVDTPNDFGRNGSRPTHPELLDWLAVEFRDGGQSLKKLHRLIMLSSAYRQSSAHDEAKAKIDADNRYLWRMNRQRLDAESIRDSVLAVSGTLDLKMYGPGYELFRFKDDHSPVYDHSDVTKINDPANWRRTVYRFVVRSVANPFLECLDCADPNINTPVRNTTLTALQALALLNNPFMVRQAEHFAKRLEAASPDRGRQIELAYRLAFGRAPTAEEREAVAAYARRHGLANACRVLLNANEFLFID